MIARICKFFGVAPDVAERQDVALCESIIAMTTFAELADMETRGEPLTAEQRDQIIALEHAAGII